MTLLKPFPSSSSSFSLNFLDGAHDHNDEIDKDNWIHLRWRGGGVFDHKDWWVLPLQRSFNSTRLASSAKSIHIIIDADSPPTYIIRCAPRNSPSRPSSFSSCFLSSSPFHEVSQDFFGLSKKKEEKMLLRSVIACRSAESRREAFCFSSTSPPRWNGLYGGKSPFEVPPPSLLISKPFYISSSSSSFFSFIQEKKERKESSCPSPYFSTSALSPVYRQKDSKRDRNVVMPSSLHLEMHESLEGRRRAATRSHCKGKGERRQEKEKGQKEEELNVDKEVEEEEEREAPDIDEEEEERSPHTSEDEEEDFAVNSIYTYQPWIRECEERLLDTLEEKEEEGEEESEKDVWDLKGESETWREKTWDYQEDRHPSWCGVCTPHDSLSFSPSESRQCSLCFLFPSLFFHYQLPSSSSSFFSSFASSSQQDVPSSPSFPKKVFQLGRRTREKESLLLSKPGVCTVSASSLICYPPPSNRPLISISPPRISSFSSSLSFSPLSFWTASPFSSSPFSSGILSSSRCRTRRRKKTSTCPVYISFHSLQNESAVRFATDPNHHLSLSSSSSPSSSSSLFSSSSFSCVRAMDLYQYASLVLSFSASLSSSCHPRSSPSSPPQRSPLPLPSVSPSALLACDTKPEKEEQQGKEKSKEEEEEDDEEEEEEEDDGERRTLSLSSLPSSSFSLVGFIEHMKDKEEISTFFSFGPGTVLLRLSHPLSKKRFFSYHSFSSSRIAEVYRHSSLCCHCFLSNRRRNEKEGSLGKKSTTDAPFTSSTYSSCIGPCSSFFSRKNRLSIQEKEANEKEEQHTHLSTKSLLSLSPSIHSNLSLSSLIPSSSSPCSSSSSCCCRRGLFCMQCSPSISQCLSALQWREREEAKPGRIDLGRKDERRKAPEREMEKSLSQSRKKDRPEGAHHSCSEDDQHRGGGPLLYRERHEGDAREEEKEEEKRKTEEKREESDISSLERKRRAMIQNTRRTYYEMPRIYPDGCLVEPVSQSSSLSSSSFYPDSLSSDTSFIQDVSSLPFHLSDVPLFSPSSSSSCLFPEDIPPYESFASSSFSSFNFKDTSIPLNEEPSQVGLSPYVFLLRHPVGMNGFSSSSSSSSLLFFFSFLQERRRRPRKENEVHEKKREEEEEEHGNKNEEEEEEEKEGGGHPNRPFEEGPLHSPHTKTSLLSSISNERSSPSFFPSSSSSSVSSSLLNSDKEKDLDSLLLKSDRGVDRLLHRNMHSLTPQTHSRFSLAYEKEKNEEEGKEEEEERFLRDLPHVLFDYFVSSFSMRNREREEKEEEDVLQQRTDVGMDGSFLIKERKEEEGSRRRRGTVYFSSSEREEEEEISDFLHAAERSFHLV
ncbi:hypothetical protein CSUI_007321 [Cystoisospora suis]|uniref:Uncharacterized protein n=1 Tax=Cystoisospora suis TaxID=483139 RepID=A0A2C6KRF2_9APIC|nr:hypothetical protein CSUI_007321 [Cystoisospora suis]